MNPTLGVIFGAILFCAGHAARTAGVHGSQRVKTVNQPTRSLLYAGYLPLSHNSLNRMHFRPTLRRIRACRRITPKHLQVL